MGLWPTQGDEKLAPFTALHGGAGPPFVISTEAKRSGEISVLMLLRGRTRSGLLNGEICGLLSPSLAQISPCRIRLPNQPYLFCSAPSFDLFLPPDGIIDVLMAFKPD
jgi:hypothetical protein